MRLVARMGGMMLVVTLASSVATASESLPRPPELQPAVDFWKRIYTDVDSDHGLIHDRRYLGRVYDRVHIPRDQLAPERRHQRDTAKEHIREVLRSLAAQGGEARTAEQGRIRNLFADDADAADFEQAAGRLRFQRGLSDRFRAGYERSGRWYGHIREILREHDVPPEVAALPHVESSFRADVTSHAYAVGLWQFTRLGATDYMRVDHIIDERRDPWRASEGAAELLSHAYDRLGDWALAITAYNHGIAGMKRAVRAVGEPSIARIIASYDGRNFGFASRNFYPAFLAAVDVDRNAAKHFGDIERAEPPELVTVPVPDYTEIGGLTSALPGSTDQLRELNRSLGEAVWSGRKYVPEGYEMRVPADDPQAVRSAMKQVPLSRRFTDQRPDREHRVARGQTLSGIAQRYGVSVDALVAANNLSNQDYLRPGQVLRLPMAGEQPVSIATKRGRGSGADGSYTVRSGDTLSTIANRLGTTVDRLSRLNGINNPHSIRAGQTLRTSKQPSLSQAGDSNDDEG